MKPQFINGASGTFHRAHLVIVCLALVVASCVPTVVQRSVNRETPPSYQGSSDTLNSATMNWREYYRDANL
ncbi:MAG: hypothetical protein FGM33_09475, partial [Candidatus Kapabacteria bacterium]|nr:hypothetical protein [Candidatus Kapabacteria bacterium]